MKAHRGIILSAAAIIGMMVGALYIWSIFKEPLMEYHNWDSNQVTLAYSLFTTVALVGTFSGGALQRRFKPSVLIFVAGTMQALGFLLTGFVSNLTELYIFFSLVGGLGHGLIYNTAVTTATKWFPDKRGFANGICIGAMGLAPLIFAPLANYFIVHFGVTSSFKFTGLIMLAVFAVLSWFIKAPDEAESSVQAANSSVMLSTDLPPAKMLRTGTFWTIWISAMCAICSGVMMTGQAASIAANIAQVSSAQASFLICVLSIASFTGRFVLGSLSDKYGRLRIVLILLAVNAVVMLAVFPHIRSFSSFIPAIFMVGINFGGIMSILPSLCADLYGTQHFSLNYPFFYSAYTAASFASPMLASAIFQKTSSYAGVASIIGCIFTIISMRLSKK